MICIPQGSSSPTYMELYETLKKTGYIIGENLEELEISLRLKSEEEALETGRVIEESCDLFFTTGDQIDTVFMTRTKALFFFIGTSSPGRKIPLEMRATTTGFFWESTAAVFKKSLAMLPEEKRTKVGLIHYKGSKLANRVPVNKKICKKLGVQLEVQVYGEKKTIQKAMKEFKGLGVNAVILFPPALQKRDMPELVKWQYKLKIPVLAQLQNQIESHKLIVPDKLNISNFLKF